MRVKSDPADRPGDGGPPVAGVIEGLDPGWLGEIGHAGFDEGGHAFNLKWHWKGPIPGATNNDGVDAAGLAAWVTSVRTKLAAEGRKDIGDQRIGAILWYAPAGGDGIHPHEAVREVLEREASGHIDTGFRIEAVNSRGAVFRGKGGDQEREIAAGFQQRAEELLASWPRTSRIFASLAEQYEADARREDERALLGD